MFDGAYADRQDGAARFSDVTLGTGPLSHGFDVEVPVQTVGLGRGSRPALNLTL